MSVNAVSLTAIGGARTALAESTADWRRPFQRLDALLAEAVAEARSRFGAEAGHDSFRGLYITEENAADALRHPPGEPLRPQRAAEGPPAGTDVGRGRRASPRLGVAAEHGRVDRHRTRCRADCAGP